MKHSISQMDFSGTMREQFLGMIQHVDQTLDKMLAASSQEEFNQAASGLMMMMPFTGPGLPPAGDNGPALPDLTTPPDAKERRY